MQVSVTSAPLTRITPEGIHSGGNATLAFFLADAADVGASAVGAADSNGTRALPEVTTPPLHHASGDSQQLQAAQAHKFKLTDLNARHRQASS